MDLKICCLCLGEKPTTNIYEKFADKQNDLPENIYLITGVRIAKDSNYPTGVCQECIRDLQFCMSFRRIAQQSYESINNGYNFSSALHADAAKHLKPNHIQSTACDVETRLDKRQMVLYQCEKCNQNFSKKTDWIAHAKTGICIYDCPHCPMIFSKEPFFKFHLAKHRKSKQETSETQLEMEVEPELKSETSAADAENVYKCSDCNIVFAEEPKLIAHNIRRHDHRLVVYACAFCQNTFITESRLDDHVQEVHAETVKIQYQCDICSCPPFEQLNKLIEHRDEHIQTDENYSEVDPAYYESL